MDSFHKHLLERITNLEIELNSLREVTWPVCQSLWDKDGPYENRGQKLRFFKWLFREQIIHLLQLKARYLGTSQDLVSSELQWILVEAPGQGEVLV
jgi:hypothetical protein